MEHQLSYIPRRLREACSLLCVHRAYRATEHSAGHVTHRSAVLAAGRNERRCSPTFCLRPHHRLALARLGANLLGQTTPVPSL
jgi:hypothetical protein